VSDDAWSQLPHDVRFEWGPTGAAELAGQRSVTVIVDVLSFTTSVTVAVERGTDIYPAATRMHAEQLARDAGAVLAAGRRGVTKQHPWSLSSAALLAAPAPDRLVLPSPNGSTIAAAARGTVVAASLRNADAVGAWLAERVARQSIPVVVIAAGERWPDGSLRPALEDLLGAGALLDAIAHRTDFRLSPEASAARAAFQAANPLADTIRSCSSGMELAAAGFAVDVDIAVELNTSGVVPVLVDGAFRPASWSACSLP
jgi:2-phosphosulfolactate phosphatase